MPHRRLFITGLLLFLLAACTPTPSSPAPEASPQPADPTTAPVVIQPTVEVPTATATPTEIPIELPVNRFTGLPNLFPLTAENIPDLKAVGTFQDAGLMEVKISSAQDRAVFVFNNGVQAFNLPDLSPSPFLPLELRNVGGRRIYQLSADARYLAAISKTQKQQTSNTVIIWNLQTQKQTCTLTFAAPVDSDSGGPLTMEFFPETSLFLLNGRLGSGGNYSNEVRLVNLSTCQAVFEFQPRLWPIVTVAPDGSSLAYVKETPSTYGPQAYLFNTRDKSEKMIGDEGNLRGVGFTADSKAVIISSTYHTTMFDVASGEILAQLDANVGKDTVYLYPLQDGHRILIAGNNSNIIWDFTDNTSFSIGKDLISAFRDLFDNHNGVVVTWESAWNLEKRTRVSLAKYPNGNSFFALSRDGLFMAIESGYTPWQTDIFDFSSGRVVASLPGERGPVAVGDLFLTEGKGKSFLHRFETGEIIATIDIPVLGGVSLGEAQGIFWDAQGNVYLLDGKTGETLHQSTLPVIPLTFQPPDYYLTRNAFPAWEQSLGYDPTSLLTGFGRDTVLLSPDGKTAIWMPGDHVQIYRVEDGIFHPTTENLLASYSFKGVWFEFAFSPDSTLVAGKTYNQLIIWDAQTGKQVRAFIGADYLKSQWNNMGFSPDGNLVLLDSTQEKDRVLVILDVQTGKLVRTHSVVDCPVSIPFVFTPDGSGVFTVSPDCRIGLYSLADWQKVKTFGEPILGAKLSLALSQDGKLLAVGSKSFLGVFDTQSGKLLKQIDGLNTGITDFLGDFKLVFSQDGKFLAARYGHSVFSDTTVTLFGVPQP